jgi:sRNA-binding regulator protein Hfq
MKDAADSLPLERQEQAEGFANRRLIRPNLTRPDHNGSGFNHGAPGADRHGLGGKKAFPAEVTHAENFYYQKQMQAKTPMVIVLRDGEEIRGVIEWYDKSCLKVVRPGGSSLLIYKPAIKYMFKEGENARK